MKKFLAFSHSDVVFIMLINVKMPTIEQDKFCAELAWKKFYNRGDRLLLRERSELGPYCFSIYTTNFATRKNHIIII